MTRSLTFIVGLLFAGSIASAQELVTSPVAASAHILYEQPVSVDASSQFVAIVDGVEFLSTNVACTKDPAQLIRSTCMVTPEPAFFVAINRTPFPHMLDGKLRTNEMDSLPASQIRLTPPQPPPPVQCDYFNLAGAHTPKAIGDRSVFGWNVINPLDPASLGATYDRELQLRAWGFAYRVLATDDGFHVFKDGKTRILIYAPCVGVPQ